MSTPPPVNEARMRGIREVPSVRFRDPSRDCTPRQPGLSSPEYSNISGVSPPEFLASANLLHSLNISEVSPPEFLASANLPDSLNISGVSPLPEFPSQTYLTALDLSIPTKARLVSPPQRATAQVVDPTRSGKWKLQSERPPSARRLQKPWAKIQAKRKIKKPQLNILNQAYGEVPDLPPDKHRPTQYSFTYSPSQRFKPKAVSTPKPEGWESCGSYQHWSPNAGTAHTGEYGWVSTDTDYSPVQSPAHVVPPCPNLPPDKHRPTQYSFTYSPSQRFKPKAVSTPKPEGWESCGSYQHWSPNAGTAHTGEYGWVSTDTDYSPVQSPAHVVPPCPNLPPDKHRPTQYSFTYSPSQRFKPKAVSTPKPEGWESCGSYQHWSPNAGTAHTGEYGWVSLDTDYSPVQSPAHVVPPCPEQCQDSFQRISGRDRTVHVSADSEQQEYDDIDESLLLMWGLTMRRADIPLDPYYEQCIMASPNMIKNPRILANLRREYAEKKRKVQEALERQRFEQALQDLPEVERREITDLENKIIERETEKLRHLLRMLSDKKKLALKNVRVAECLYVEEAQNVKVSIAILENAKKDEDEARIDLKETRQKYSNRQKVKELKRTLKAMKAYKDGLIEERQEILKKKEELLAELKVSEGVESTQAYLNAIKEKSEWWVQELRNRVKNKGESLKAVTQSLEREQKRIEALKQETEETEKLTQEVQIEVDKILLSIKTLSPVIEQLKREIDLKLPAGEPQTPPAGLPMPSPRKKLISQIQFLHKAIEEEKELIHDSLQMLYEEMINYDRIISQGLEHHLRILSQKKK